MRISPAGTRRELLVAGPVDVATRGPRDVADDVHLGLAGADRRHPPALVASGARRDVEPARRRFPREPRPAATFGRGDGERGRQALATGTRASPAPTAGCVAARNGSTNRSASQNTWPRYAWPVMPRAPTAASPRSATDAIRWKSASRTSSWSCVVALDADVGALPALRPRAAVLGQQRVEAVGPRARRSSRRRASGSAPAVARDVGGDPIEACRIALLPRGRGDRAAASRVSPSTRLRRARPSRPRRRRARRARRTCSGGSTSARRHGDARARERREPHRLQRRIAADRRLLAEQRRFAGRAPDAPDRPGASAPGSAAHRGPARRSVERSFAVVDAGRDHLGPGRRDARTAARRWCRSCRRRS